MTTLKLHSHRSLIVKIFVQVVKGKCQKRLKIEKLTYTIVKLI